jgi:hypothetical protein
MRTRLVILLAGLAAACSPKAAETPFDATLSTKELMQHVIDPAAVGLWGRAGEMQTETGEVVDLAPDTEEEWKAAEGEAAIVAEAGNLLILPQRVRVLKDAKGDPDKADGGDWTKFSIEMTKKALDVKTATAARDKARMFDAGGELYQTCVACHDKYYVPFLKEDEDPNSDAPR